VSRFRGSAVLLWGLIAAAALFLARLDYGRRITTDVLDLIPAGERSPELALVRSLANEQQARVALFALQESDPAKREAAAAAFAAALRTSPAFVEVVRMGEVGGNDALARQVFEQRLALLLPGWLAARQGEYAAQPRSDSWPAWLAEASAARLEAFLPRTEALAFQDLLPADPLLLLPNLLVQAQSFLSTNPSTGDRALIWARTSAAPLREEGQAPVFAAVDQALAAARAVAPGTQLRWTAISRFAAESRRRIEQEMSWLNIVSLGAVLGVAVVCLRRMFKSLHLAAVVICAMLGAWTVTTLAFERVHVLVFVVGSLLGGVAIDYGFYLYLQPPQPADEPYRAKVRRLAKPLLASALTTVIGFSLLLFSELPLIRQLGVFVSAGLLCALGGAVLWFDQLKVTYMETRPFARARWTGGGATARYTARGLLVAGGIVALVGPWRLHWRDDIRELEISAPELRAEAVELRALFGETANRTVYLTRGSTPADARTALTHFLAWHATEFPGRGAASLGLVLPAPVDWAALPTRQQALAGFETEFRAALARHGFEAAGFEPFFTAWRAWRETPPVAYDEAVRALTGALRGPTALLLATTPGASWFATIADHPPGAEPPAATATVSSSQLEHLNQLFARYRTSALHLSALGLSLVGASVFVLYGFRRGPRIFALPCGSCLFAFGLLGLAGQTLNLFHLLGAFLGVCLSHNYAIFSAENAARGDEPPPSIRLSALTTAASFGVLAASRIPVVAALGTTVTLIVCTALVAVELEPLARKARPQP
jgi:predicted exporter